MTTTTKPSAAARKSLGAVVVRTLNEAVTAAMNELGNRHGCRPMNWYLPEVNGFDRGDVIGFPGPDIDEPAHGVLVAERWATLLGLAEQANESGRYRSWVGVAGTSRIEIWCRATMTPAGVS